MKKNVFLEEGRLEESLDVLEDWDLRVRYAIKNDFLYVEKVTSTYRIPFDRQISNLRKQELDEALGTLREKHKTYYASINVADIAEELQRVLDSYIVRISSEVFNQIQAK